MLEKGIISNNIIAESIENAWADKPSFTGLYRLLREKHPQLRDLLGEEPDFTKLKQQARLNRADHSGNYFVYYEGAEPNNALKIDYSKI